MNFTYTAYIEMIKLLENMKYNIASYDNYQRYDKCVILRHDIDYRIESAYKLGQIEYKDVGVKSTYFLLLTSDFYNVFSLSSMKMIDGILACGHEIGLHFDEYRYYDLADNRDAIKDKILHEADVLSKAVGTKITKVSMHRPSKVMLNSDMEIPGIINTYNTVFFRDFKYLSDSRRTWREPVEDIIRKSLYKRLQILVHPFWYYDKEINIQESVKRFIDNANVERYLAMDSNISNLSEIMR